MVDRTEPENEEKKEEKMHSIPLATIRRIMKENGINKITEDAITEVCMMLSDVLRDVSNNAVVFTKHAKRKITTKEDILLSLR